MQTFVPATNFSECARILDNRRLGKQRVEVYQILNTLSGKSKGWVNHPAVKMWQGYEQALILYGVACCDEWIRRGFKDTTKDKIEAFTSLFDKQFSYPAWWYGEIHETHKSNLLRKDKVYYSKYGWNDNDTLNYYWPSKETL
jgi:hypothetical protein